MLSLDTQRPHSLCPHSESSALKTLTPSAKRNEIVESGTTTFSKWHKRHQNKKQKHQKRSPGNHNIQRSILYKRRSIAVLCRLFVIHSIPLYISLFDAHYLIFKLEPCTANFQNQIFWQSYLYQQHLHHYKALCSALNSQQLGRKHWLFLKESESHKRIQASIIHCVIVLRDCQIWRD